MANTPYVPERQTEYWTSRQVEEYFLDVGFRVLPLPITQLAEKELPADFIFFDKGRSKLFGFQYKALYHNGEDYWPLNANQHGELSSYPWIYYCLSELQNAQDHRVSLYQARIVENDFGYRQRLSPAWKTNNLLKPYTRWEAFYRRLEKCLNGVLIHSEKHLKEVLMANRDSIHLERMVDMLIDMYLADFASKNVIHFSPLLADRRTAAEHER